MQHRPSHFERRHEVVIHQKRVRQRHVEVGRGRRVGFGPARRPVLETQIADAGGRIRGLLRRKGAGLNRAPGHERIGEERQLMAPREVQVVVAVADVLDQRPDECET